MTTHTAAPWHTTGTNPPMVFAREGLDIIAQCDSGCEAGNAQELANARLIAAAPDLLQVCRDAEELCRELLCDAGIDRENCPTMRRIRAAIAKAEGR